MPTSSSLSFFFFVPDYVKAFYWNHDISSCVDVFGGIGKKKHLLSPLQFSTEQILLRVRVRESEREREREQ